MNYDTFYLKIVEWQLCRRLVVVSGGLAVAAGHDQYCAEILATDKFATPSRKSVACEIQLEEYITGNASIMEQLSIRFNYSR